MANDPPRVQQGCSRVNLNGQAGSRPGASTTTPAPAHPASRGWSTLTRPNLGSYRFARPAPPCLQGRPEAGPAARQQPPHRGLWRGRGPPLGLPLQPAGGHFGAPGGGPSAVHRSWCQQQGLIARCASSGTSPPTHDQRCSCQTCAGPAGISARWCTDPVRARPRAQPMHAKPPTCRPINSMQIFGVPSISARFGTSPEPWNWGMVAMARLAPKSERLMLWHSWLR